MFEVSQIIRLHMASWKWWYTNVIHKNDNEACGDTQVPSPVSIEMPPVCIV